MASNEYYCVCCKQRTHSLTDCRLFKILRAEERKYICNGYSICRSCLKAGHLTQRCKDQSNLCLMPSCIKNRKTHHKLLHEFPPHEFPVPLEKEICWKCGEEHPALSCPVLLDLDSTGRLAAVTLANACTLCLKIGHFLEYCPEAGEKECHHCHSQFHHTFLHLEDCLVRTPEIEETSVQTSRPFASRRSTDSLSRRLKELQEKDPLTEEEMTEMLSLGQQLLEDPASCLEATDAPMDVQPGTNTDFMDEKKEGEPELEEPSDKEEPSNKCPVCQEELHSLENCQEFVASDMIRREELVHKYACALCLRVTHRAAQCSLSHKLTGNLCEINGCRGLHHPLLHRIKFDQALWTESNKTFHWHAQDRHRLLRSGFLAPFKCAICGETDHTAMECGRWSCTRLQRFNKATSYKLCHCCLEAEHVKKEDCLCPEIICGVDRCIGHHHPFLHPVVGRPLVGNGRIGLLQSIREAKETGPRAVEQVLERAKYQDLHAIFQLREAGPFQVSLKEDDSTRFKMTVSEEENQMKISMGRDSFATLFGSYTATEVVNYNRTGQILTNFLEPPAPIALRAAFVGYVHQLLSGDALRDYPQHWKHTLREVAVNLSRIP